MEPKQSKKSFWSRLGNLLLNTVLVILSLITVYLFCQLLVNIFILKVY